MKNLTLFEGSRTTMDEAINLTVESLNLYREKYDHWVFGFSGGKDSSATVTLVTHLIETGRVKAPKSIKILYADTRMELPPLHISALNILKTLEHKGFQTEIVTPELDQRFFVYMFGRGIPPPSPTFRYCTGILKVNPMQKSLVTHAVNLGFGEISVNEKGNQIYQGYGKDKLLMITGVRLGESAARDERIILSCSKDSGECGQGYLQKTAKESLNDVLAPIVHFRVCHIWDWLMFFAPSLGFDTRPIAEVYGIDEDNSTTESDARTGCMQCNVAKKDTAFDNILKIPYWAYTRPIKRLRPLYAELREAKNRLRQHGEKNAAGELVKNQGRLGPLTFDARWYGLEQVLKIQNEINEVARRENKPLIHLINDEELLRIHQLIEAKTFPDKWTGNEMTGDMVTNKIFYDGSVQPWMFGEVV